MAESPADEIRRAAALMRERAEAAPQAPWSTRTFPASRTGVHLKPERHVVVAGGMNIAEADKSAIGHIASWHPLVALAVADWLSAFAGRGCDQDFAVPDWNGARAIARAYLGEAAT